MREGRRRAQAGFTLIELMISLVLFSLAVAGILSVAVSMTRASREQRRVVATENAVRAPIEYLADAVRGVSPGVPTGAISDTETCANGAVVVTDNTNAPDELEIVFASGGIVTMTHGAFDNTSTTLLVADASQIVAGDYVLISNVDQGALARVIDSDPATNTLTLAASTCPTAFPAANYPAGSLLVRAQRAHFTIADLDGIPTLWMDPDGPLGARPREPLAEGVEDLQIAIGIDGDNDGVLSEIGLGAGDDEWIGNVGTELLPAGNIRALRITLIARETGQLSGGNPTFFRPEAGNRAESGTLDNYRRRVLTSTVEIRNLAGSP